MSLWPQFSLRSAEATLLSAEATPMSAEATPFSEEATHTSAEGTPKMRKRSQIIFFRRRFRTNSCENACYSK
eukprot:8032290-Prorocentrum_lima.AAC.1